jgi:hypothetical protein
VPKIKHVIDNLGRCEKDGYAKGTHFVQILTYGQNKKSQKCGAFPQECKLYRLVASIAC